jgi:predicted MFS family arabinose efflux permease
MAIGKLGMAMGLWIASINSGRIIGSILGPYFMNHWTYPSAFVLSAVAALISSIIALTMLEEPKHHKSSRTAPLKKKILKVFQKKQILLLLGVGIVQIMGDVLTIIFLPLFVVERFNATPIEVGWLAAIATSSMVLTTFLSGPLADKIGKKRTILIGFILMLTSSISYLLIDTMIATFVLTAGMAAGFAFVGPSILALLPDLVTSDIYGSVMGMYGTFEDLGITIAPLLYGFVWTLYGVNAIFYACALVQLLGIGLILVMNEKR